MTAEERRYHISQIVKNQGFVSVEELQKQFKVSRMTIWRDLKELEERNILSRVHGGAMRIDKLDPQEEEFEKKRKSRSLQKRLIAKYVAENLISDSDILFLDGGTTVLEVIPYLKQKNLTLLTNGLNTLVEVSKYVPDINLIVSGGILRKPSFTFVGPEAQEFLNRYKVDKAIISGTGFTLEDGIMDPHPLEMEAKKTMCKNAKEVIVLMDSSKFNKHSLSTLIHTEQINYFITDSEAPSEMIHALKERGIKVEIVKI